LRRPTNSNSPFNSLAKLFQFDTDVLAVQPMKK